MRQREHARNRDTQIETRRDSHGNSQRETLIEVRDRDLQKQIEKDRAKKERGREIERKTQMHIETGRETKKR